MAGEEARDRAIHGRQPGAVEAVRRKVLVTQLGPRASEALGLSESQAQRKERHARGKAASDRDDA